MLVPVELIPYEHEFFQCGGEEEHFSWDPWKADKALAEMEATEKVEQGWNEEKQKENQLKSQRPGKIRTKGNTFSLKES